MIAALALALVMQAPAPRPSAPPVREQPVGAAVQGRVRSAGERAPIAGAKIFASSRGAPAWTREAVSQADGSFVLTDLPSRDFVLTIVAAGHARFEQATTAAYWRGRRPPTIFLQPTGAGRYRTIVATSRAPRASPVSRELAPDEIAALPGSQGDPLRALQNLPGVARVPAGLGLIVLRGATPNQSQVFFGEHPLPRAFHIPGLMSVVPGAVLAGLNYVAGNFDSSYGNAVGGIVTLTPRVGRRDGIHGHAKLDIISAGAAVEGPMHRGSFLIAAQRGYLDLALKAMEPLTGRFVLPRSYDYQAIFDHPVGARASLTLRLLGVGDAVRYPNSSGVEDDPATTFSVRSDFHRIDLSYRKRIDAWDFLLAPAVRLDRGSGGAPAYFFTRRNDVVGLLRAEIGVRPSQRFHLVAGADTQLDRFTALNYVPADESDGREEVRTDTRGFASNSGAYMTATLTFGRLSLVPGVRASGFTSGTSRAFAVDPRLLVRWSPHERVTLSFGAGLYSQPSVLRSGLGSLVPGLSNGGLDPLKDGQTVAFPLGSGAIVLPGAIRYLDPRLEFDPKSAVSASKAGHLSAGVHVDLPAELGLDATVFYRRVNDNLPASPQLGIFFSAPGTGSTVHGLEVLLRRALGRRFHGWIAYTWMRASKGIVDRWALESRRPADFDQQHNLVIVLLARLPRRWELGGRFRVVTGLPYTPFVGSFYDPGCIDEHCPIEGEPNGARMPVFHQLDVRLDKTWVLRRSVVAAYFDVQNIYNRQNAEGLIYNRYYTKTTAAVGVPILPVLGVRVSY